MPYETHEIIIYTTDQQELIGDARFWVDAGKSMSDEVGGPGPWVEATLSKYFLGGLGLSREQMVEACGKDAVSSAESDVSARIMRADYEH